MQTNFLYLNNIFIYLIFPIPLYLILLYFHPFHLLFLFDCIVQEHMFINNIFLCIFFISGADYAYIMETFGPFMAFIRLWIECMIVRPCSQAIVALTFSTYVLKPFFPECEPPEDAARLLAVCCICKYTVKEKRI